jgi:hypothetical protein
MKFKILPIIGISVVLLTMVSCTQETRNENAHLRNSKTVKKREFIPDRNLHLNPKNSKKTKIKLALILDTSNSMDGLIDQAKNQLWKIVMELAKTKDKNNEDPSIDLALYQYGNDNLSLRNGYVELVQKFTGELDEISEKLFALKTNGGEEYCGQVINSSLNELKWSASSQDLQMIYIAGNERFNQGDFDYKKVCSWAKEKNITVNTIFCGKRKEGVKTFWKHGADLTGGQFACIDSDVKSVHYESPYDEDISKLNVQLNKTYVPYSVSGIEKKQKQLSEDRKVQKLNKSMASKRYLSKGSKVYRNNKWDLVDYASEESFDVDSITTEALPDSLGTLSKTELKKKIKTLSESRKKIKEEMADLSRKREDYVQGQKSKAANSDTNMLEDAIIKGLKDQAEKKSIKFENKMN